MNSGLFLSTKGFANIASSFYFGSIRPNPEEPKNMNEEDRQFIKSWKIQRQHRWKFLLKVGVLYWGLPTFLFYWLFTFFFEQQVTIDRTWLAVHFLGFSAAGLAYAFFRYRSNEKLFHELRNS